MKPFIGSIPVHNQRGKKICWAWVLSDWLSINYIITKDQGYYETSLCSPVDLLNWFYSMPELYQLVDDKGAQKIFIDDTGFYFIHVALKEL